jgi:hypothetical protein
MSIGFGGWGDLMVVHSFISCEVVTSVSTRSAEDIMLGGGRGATGQGRGGRDLLACRQIKSTKAASMTSCSAVLAQSG